MKNLFLGTAALALTASLAMADTVRLGTEGAYPPYNFINDAGDVDGFERELGDELCARAELTCEWVTNEWDSIIPNLLSGNYDTIIAGMSITDEREEVVDFTQGYTRPSPSAKAASSRDSARVPICTTFPTPASRARRTAVPCEKRSPPSSSLRSA